MEAVMTITPQPSPPAGASLWPAALILWGRGSRSSPHAHHCIQVYLALAGTVRARSGPGARWRQCEAVVVGPDVRHEIDASHGRVLMGFFDPESELASSLWAGTGTPAEITVLSDAVAAGWRAILGDPNQIDKTHVDRWIHSALLHDRRPRSLHPAVERALNYLRNGALQQRQLSAKHLSHIAQLSPSRFLHVFTESLGIPLRSYVRWLRVQRAMGALAGGCGITDAAHVAGFSDAAHLSRSLRRTLGHTPSELVRKCVLGGEMDRAAL